MTQPNPPGRGARRGPRQRSAARPSERSARTDPSRLAAYTVMRAIDEGGYANLELPRELTKRGLHGRDAAFATELTYGATRLRGRYDAIIARAADRPVERIDPAVLDTLRLGAHQLLGMRVAAHAAVDQTVALARTVNGMGASGLVNAVMRRISEADPQEWLIRIAPPEADPISRMALANSHPEWIVKALRQALLGHGRANAETVTDELTALLEADNIPAEVTLVARPGLSTRDELARAGARASDHVGTAATLSGGDPGAIAAVRDGRAAVQDAGSQVVALALAAAPLAGDRDRGSAPRQNDPSPRQDVPAVDRDAATSRARERWLDLCAGPGGKAGLLAALAAERGVDLVANEIAEHRAELVRKTLDPAFGRAKRLGLDLDVRVGDGRDFGAQEPGEYDRVLLDAPCTGLGALRRRPEARWRRTPADLAGLGGLQRELLASGLAALAPGGVLVYATCSPHLAETTFVVSDALKKNPAIEQLDARPIVAAVTTGWVDQLGPGPGVQMWPHVHDTDGMFLAVLRRRP